MLKYGSPQNIFSSLKIQDVTNKNPAGRRESAGIRRTRTLDPQKRSVHLCAFRKDGIIYQVQVTTIRSLPDHCQITIRSLSSYSSEHYHHIHPESLVYHTTFKQPLFSPGAFALKPQVL